MVLGGGYTGMWTAWFLKERDPSCDVVLLEADELCGSGPSGRNGGFCYGLWEDLEALVRFFGAADALRVAHVAQRSVDEIEAWLAERDVDAWFTRAGHLTVATSAAQDGAWSSLVAEADRLGVLDGRFVELDDDQVRARCLSPVFRGGLLQPENAILQPARLALGLRAALLERGVRIHESTAAVRFTEGPPVRVETDRGATVVAEHGVLGLGAWAASLPRFRRSIVPRGTYIVVTEPAPDAPRGDRLDRGRGPRRLADRAPVLPHHARRADRVRRGVRGGRPRGRARSPAPVRRSDRWPRWSTTSGGSSPRGPTSRSRRPGAVRWTSPGDTCRRSGRCRAGTLHYGLGYTGGGVGPCHLGGKILSALALGVEDEHTALPLVDLEMMRFPPEPFLSVGAAITQHAIVRKDEAEDRGRRTDPLTRFVAKLPRRMGYELGP